MKYFWYSLIIFCVLMCSCKTQKLDSNVQVRSDVQSELVIMSESVKIDTTKTIHSEQFNQRIVIEEETTIVEYDKESGKPIKKTTSKRKTTQDSDKVVTEEANQAVTSSNQMEADHFADVSKKIDSEIKEESIGGQESFGKWFGIVIGVVVGLLLLYLLKKMRVS